MVGHDFYKSMGDYYFGMAAQQGMTGILPAAKKCYAVAATNLKQIIDVSKEPMRKEQYLKQFNGTMVLAESIHNKIKSDPVKFDIQKKYLS